MSRRLRSAWTPPPRQRSPRRSQVRHPVRDGTRRVTRSVPVVGAGERLPGPLVLDLVAAVLAGGASPPGALREVGAALTRVGDPVGHRLQIAAAELVHPAAGSPATPVPGDWVEVLREELALAMRSGLPPAALLRRAAEEQRRRSAAAQRRAVQRLEVLLVVPTGLCLLPAFVFLGIVPVVLGLLHV